MPLPSLRIPVVAAPMAGGPTTPALVAAVSGAGGLGMLAAGYLTTDRVATDIAAVRAATAAPFGVNVFLPGPEPDPAAVAAYARRLAPEADRRGVPLGEPAGGDDDWAAKVELLAAERVPVVSFAFGVPPADAVEALHRAGAAVLVTVTTADEAVAAAGADALVVQGAEAGAHRGGPTDPDRDELGLLPLLRLVARVSPLPLVAAGGIADGAAVAAVLAAGATWAQLGTAFLRCPEAGTAAVHRAALAAPGDTVLTRAFTGRRARALVTPFVTAHSAAAPAAYPHVHQLTAPLRAAARAAGDAAGVNLWAGQAHELAPDLPAADLVARLGADARAALRAAVSGFPG